MLQTVPKIDAGASTNRWLTWLKPNARARLRLFCFPYAGGGAHIYQTWGDHLPASVEICSINLPGRGARMWEPPYSEAAPLAESLLQAMTPYLDKPFAFFGHSMGAIVGFELARHLRKCRVTPAHFFVSGCHAPQIPDPHPIHHLPDADFLAALVRLGGVPEAVMRDAELMDLILPTIRADFTLVETYPFTPQPPLACPLTAFGGIDDDLVEREHLEAWRAQTRAEFEVVMLPGNHFFLHSAHDSLLRLLSRQLDKY